MLPSRYRLKKGINPIQPGLHFSQIKGKYLFLLFVSSQWDARINVTQSINVAPKLHWQKAHITCQYDISLLLAAFNLLTPVDGSMHMG
jgi:hypothetical protein